MKRKILYILTALLLLAGIFAAALYGAEEELSYSLNQDAAGYTVTGIGSVRDKDIVIPDSYEGLPVTSIATRAFEQNKKITSVAMGDNVTSIGDFVFSGCTSLRIVNMSTRLITMGKGAFYNCTALETADLPSSLSVLGDWAFWNCSSLTSLVLPESVSSVGIGAFNGCAGLSQVTLNTRLASLSQYMFADCSSLRTITLPQAVSVINEYVFADCYNLTDIFFSNSGVNINGKAFYGVAAKAHYSCSDSSWSSFPFQGFGGDLTWISHTNVVHYPAVPATEDSEGNIEYWYCEDCRKYYADEALTQEINPGSIVTPAIGDVLRGDVDGNGMKNGDDVLRALYHLFYPEVYIVNQNLDFNGDGKENGDDVLRLLYNLFYADAYPLL